LAGAEGGVMSILAAILWSLFVWLLLVCVVLWITT